MTDLDPVAVEQDAERRRLEQLLEQLRVEALALEGEVLELLRVDQPASPVVPEDELVLRHHVLPADLLGPPDVVADHLEGDVVGREREDGHHQPALSRGATEGVAGVAQVLQQVAIQLGLAVLVEAERGPQLVQPLARQDRVQEVDERHWPLHLDHEVGAGEAEHARGVVLVDERRVGHQPVGTVQKGQDQRPPAAAGPQPPDHVGPLVAVEERRQHLRLERAARVGSGRPLDHLRHRAHVRLERAPRRRETVALEDATDQLAGVRVDEGDVQRRLGLGGSGVEVRVDELDAGVDADGGEHPPCDRVEKRLGERAVGAARDAGGEGLLDRSPQLPVAEAWAELLPQLGDRGVGGLAVQAEPLDRVRLRAVPVARLEAGRRPAGDVVEALAKRRPLQGQELGGAPGHTRS